MLSMLLTLAVAQTPARMVFPAEGLIDIPFERNSNKIYLQAKVDNSRAMWFILDTGAPTTMLDMQAAKRLRLTLSSGGTTTGAGEGQTNIAKTSARELQIEGLKFALGEITAIELDSVVSAHEGRHVDGLIGGDFFENAVVEIDYLNSRLRIHDPSKFKYEGSGSRIKLEKQGGHVFTSVTIKPRSKEPITLKTLIDTGARISLTVSAPVVNEHRLLETAPTISATVGFGIGGELIHQVGRLESMQVGDQLVEEPYVTYSGEMAGVFGEGGIPALLGAEFLRRYRTIFDYANSVMILEPLSEASRPYIFNASGMWLIATGKDLKTYEVHSIVDGSPAAEAGFEKGDVITSINRKETAKMKFEEVRRMFSGNDEYFVVKVMRGKSERSLALRTRRYI